MSGRTLLFVVTEDWYFLSHRLGLARAARDAGYDVAVACRVRAGAEPIRREGFALHPLAWRRDVRGLAALAQSVYELTSLYRRLKPDLIHHIALMPMALGGVAARLAGQPRLVATLAGTGFLGVRDDALTRMALCVVRALNTGHGRAIIVQNEADAALLRARGFPAEALALVPGSGVDTVRFAPLPEPEGDFTIGLASRFLRFKGIEEVIAAQQRLRAQGLPVRLLLAGEPDADNPASHSPAEIEAWGRLPGVSLLGRIEDVRVLWRQCHLAVLASRGGEGVPLSLLEAAACGRAIVASDVPGCRDVAAEGAGLVVPARNPIALADAIETLLRDPARRAALAAAARRRAETRFALPAIAAQTLAVYARLFEGRP